MLVCIFVCLLVCLFVCPQDYLQSNVGNSIVLPEVYPQPWKKTLHFGADPDYDRTADVGSL